MNNLKRWEHRLAEALAAPRGAELSDAAQDALDRDEAFMEAEFDDLGDGDY